MFSDTLVVERSPDRSTVATEGLPGVQQRETFGQFGGMVGRPCHNRELQLESEHSAWCAAARPLPACSLQSEDALPAGAKQCGQKLRPAPTACPLPVERIGIAHASCGSGQAVAHQHARQSLVSPSAFPLRPSASFAVSDIGSRILGKPF